VRNPDRNVEYGRESPRDTSGAGEGRRQGYEGSGSTFRPVAGDEGLPSIFKNPAWASRRQNASNTGPKAKKRQGREGRRR